MAVEGENRQFERSMTDLVGPERFSAAAASLKVFSEVQKVVAVGAAMFFRRAAAVFNAAGLSSAGSSPKAIGN
jgi:hypothetical protein